MRRLFVAAMSIVAFTYMASAADLYEPVYKAAPPRPAPGWTGWYAGVNVGASFGNAKTDFNIAPVTVATGLPSFHTIGFAGSDTVYPDGFMGGGQIGYNWQFSPIWVVGLEADFQGALEKESATFPDNIAVPPGGGGLVLGPGSVTNYQAKIDWFGTVRLRAGYAWGEMGMVFSYVTGGLAYGKVDLEGTSTVSGVEPFPVDTPFSISNAFGHSQVNTGWVVGYGTEGRLGASRWSWKVEALYMDLGHLDTTGVTSGVSFGFNINSVSGGQVTTNTHFTDGILRGGLNYHF